PSRWTVRSIDTSGKSTSKNFCSLLNTTLTDARLARDPSPAPLKMRSSPFLPRSDLMDCSPSTKRNASATFDFPLPLGPTIAEMGAVKKSSLFFANDLKPEISIDFRYIPLEIGHERSLAFLPSYTCTNTIRPHYSICHGCS